MGIAFKPSPMFCHRSEVLNELIPRHGTDDPFIPIDPVRPQMEILRQAALKIDWREFAKPHTMAGEAEVSVLRDFVRASYD
jgi:hypothetical protein